MQPIVHGEGVIRALGFEASLNKKALLSAGGSGLDKLQRPGQGDAIVRDLGGGRMVLLDLSSNADEFAGIVVRLDITLFVDDGKRTAQTVRVNCFNPNGHAEFPILDGSEPAVIEVQGHVDVPERGIISLGLEMWKEFARDSFAIDFRPRSLEPHGRKEFSPWW